MLTKQALHIWQANWARLQPSAWQKWLTPDELARAGQFRIVQHKNRFVVTRGLLRTIIAHYIHYNPPTVPLHYTDTGKPYVKNFVNFNLSHSRDMVVFAICDISTQVGIDIESIDATLNIESIMRHYFSDSEIKAWQLLPNQARRTAFFRAWTRKEAFLKAIGLGLGFPTKEIEVSMQEQETSFLTIPIQYAAKTWYMANIKTPNAYVGSVVLDATPSSIDYFDFDTHQHLLPLPH